MSKSGPPGFTQHKAKLPCGNLVWLEAGEGPALLLLHGFPDTAATWFHLAPRYVEAGYRVLIPWMPGYAPSGIMTGDNYTVPSLARHMLSWLDDQNIATCRIIGHDWGAVTAYAMAAMAPERCLAIVCAAVPHLRRFLRLTPSQVARSWYMGYFQLRSLPERRIRRKNFQFLADLWRAWSPAWAYSSEDFAELKSCFAQQGVIEAALAYYRAMPVSFLSAERARILGRIDVPTLSIAGENDGCIGVEMFEDQAKYFSADYQFAVLPGAGHFMNREAPEAFLRRSREFLDAH